MEENTNVLLLVMRKTLYILWLVIWIPCALIFLLLCLLIPIPGWIILVMWHYGDKRKEQHRELIKHLKTTGTTSKPPNS